MDAWRDQGKSLGYIRFLFIKKKREKIYVKINNCPKKSLHCADHVLQDILLICFPSFSLLLKTNHKIKINV